MFRRIAAVVSATAGVVAVVVSLTLFGSSPRLSFADVMEKVAKTRSVTFKQTVRTPGKPAEIVRMAILADGLGRLEMPNGNYTVMDMKTGNAILVASHEKKATIMLGLDVPPGVNVYEMLRNAVNERSVRLPDEVIEGRKANVFRVEWYEPIRKQARDSVPLMKVWVDPQTKLPIRVEPMRQDDKGSLAMYDFAFDQPLDPSLFSLNPPEGYAVTTEGSANFSPPPEKPELLTPEVVPGAGLGPVKFGMSKEEVIKIFGKPDSEQVLKILGKPVAEGNANIEYPSRGYGFLISPQRGLVLVNCFSQQESAFKVRDFAGKTKEGIGIGSSRADVEKTFGKPDSVKTEQTSSYLHYQQLGLRFTLFNDKVVFFSLQAPRR